MVSNFPTNEFIFSFASTVRESLQPLCSGTGLHVRLDLCFERERCRWFQWRVHWLTFPPPLPKPGTWHLFDVDSCYVLASRSAYSWFGFLRFFLRTFGKLRTCTLTCRRKIRSLVIEYDPNSARLSLYLFLAPDGRVTSGLRMSWKIKLNSFWSENARSSDVDSIELSTFYTLARNVSILLTLK